MPDKEEIPPPDYHTHTRLCHHAEGMPLDYAQSAHEKGWTEMACTDHAPAPGDYDQEHRMESPDFTAYRQGVAEAQAAGLCRVLYGIEADYYPDCEKHLRPWLSEQRFDLVLGSIHTGDFWDMEAGNGKDYSEEQLTEVWRKYFQQVRLLAKTRMYDIVAHLDLPKRGGLRPRPETQRELVLPVLEAIANNGMAIEINTSGIHHAAQEPYPSLEILCEAREHGIPIVFGSDAHSPACIGREFPTGLQLAREAGYTEHALYRQRRRFLTPL